VRRDLCAGDGRGWETEATRSPGLTILICYVSRMLTGRFPNTDRNLAVTNDPENARDFYDFEGLESWHDLTS
jgi:hypothetical protein